MQEITFHISDKVRHKHLPFNYLILFVQFESINTHFLFLVAQMAQTQVLVQPPLFQSFPLRPSAAQTSMNGLVSALWRCLFPGQCFGHNHRLDSIFLRMSAWPELGNQQLCPLYFDHVTYSLPTRNKVKHM